MTSQQKVSLEGKEGIKITMSENTTEGAGSPHRCPYTAHYGDSQLLTTESRMRQLTLKEQIRRLLNTYNLLALTLGLARRTDL